jgi:hypothetical protein
MKAQVDMIRVEKVSNLLLFSNGGEGDGGFEMAEDLVG